MQRIHDVEADTSPTVLERLVVSVPAWTGLPLRPVGGTGTDHVVQRLGDDLVLRVPRTEAAAAGLLREVRHLARIALHCPAPVPEVVHVGAPLDGYPYPWAVLRWLQGADGWAARSTVEDPHGDALATDLAAVVLALRAAPELPVPRRTAGQRGGPLDGVVDRSLRWLDGGGGPLPGWVDGHGARRLVVSGRWAADDDVPYVLSHGDLVPGNVLLRGGRLAAVIDWGYGSSADPALDLVAGWALLGPRARAVFREAVGADDATWERARANALEQALGGVVYYTPRAHPLADVMGRTLRRLLAEADR